MGNVSIWCFYQWVDEEVDIIGIGSGDYDCDIVVEWHGGVGLRGTCADGRRGGDKNSVAWISCSFL